MYSFPNAIIVLGTIIATLTYYVNRHIDVKEAPSHMIVSDGATSSIPL